MSKEPTKIRCTAIVQPSRDSAYLSITRQDSTTELFELTLPIIKLHNVQCADAISKWPGES